MTDIRWSIDSMYEDGALEQAPKEIEKGMAKLDELAKNPEENLLEILKTVEDTNRKLYHYVTYSSMKKDEDTRVAESQKRYMQAVQYLYDFSAKTAFLDPFLLGLPEEKMEAILEDEDFAPYHLELKKLLRNKPHTLSEGEEKILSAMGKSAGAPEEIYFYLENADMKFPTIDSLDGKQLTNENFVLLQQNKDPKVRKEVFEKFYETYNSFRNTIATAYYSNIDAKTAIAKLRHFKSVREQELFTDDVSLKVYDALIESVHSYLPSLHKYFGLKKKSLGLKEQHMYDVYLDIDSGFEKEYTFEEAKELCIASVAPLGKDYQEAYKKAFEENWIDVYPREGKRGGAYSSGSYDSRPFVLMNFAGNLDSVFTLAHEMGHSMHSYYAKKSNDFLYSNYTIFAAEVASTFNENLLLDYLLKHAGSDAERLYLLNHHIDSFKSTVFRQTMFAEFEKLAHEGVMKGDGMTAQDFDSIYLDLNQKYYGDEMISDPLIAHEWMRIPHFYSNFYVYKYATGYCAATLLSRRVLDKKENAVENYHKFLKDGCKHFPIEQLRIAGIDMEKPETVNEALEVFKDRVERLAEML